MEHDFVVKNQGAAPLLIQKVSMTPPLVVTQMPQQVVAGAEGTIHLKLDTANRAGKFRGAVLVFLNDPALPQGILAFEGTVVPAIELSPTPAFFVSGQRGQGGTGAIEIINHEAAPLRIEKIEHAGDRFTTQLETLAPGERYRLILNLRPDGPVGRSSSIIVVRTSSRKLPELKLGANTYLYERVRTFPDGVDFGTVRATDPAPQTLMIYQVGGSDFRVKLSSDLPALNLKYERGPQGDRYQATISLDPNKVKAGPFNGVLTIDTNDAAFPKLTVPIAGRVLTQ